jgi:nicotinamide riboside transporter PnuC
MDTWQLHIGAAIGLIFGIIGVFDIVAGFRAAARRETGWAAFSFAGAGVAGIVAALGFSGFAALWISEVFS